MSDPDKAMVDTNTVTLPVADEFLNVVGDSWRLSNNGDPLDLQQVLAHTIRQCPVKTGDDADRTREILQVIRASDGRTIKMRKADFDWMVAHFHEFGHRVWLAPDAAELVHLLKEMVI